MEIFDQIKYFIGLSIFGMLGFFGQYQLKRIADVENRQIKIEKDVAVLEAEMRNISEDITEIKEGINKLIHKLLDSDE
jgi:hypothetical protein